MKRQDLIRHLESHNCYLLREGGRHSIYVNPATVHHREFIATAPSGRTVTVYQPDDTLNVIDLLLVTDLEIKPVTNGSGKRRRKS